MTTSAATDIAKRPVVPHELGGKWIAWTLDGSRIVASADTLDACEAAATIAGEKASRFEKIPPSNVQIIRPSLALHREHAPSDVTH